MDSQALTFQKTSRSKQEPLPGFLFLPRDENKVCNENQLQPTKEKDMRKQLKILAALLSLVGVGFVAKQILARKAG